MFKIWKKFNDSEKSPVISTQSKELPKFIEYELNATPKIHSILDFINTLEQYKICGSQNAESVRCPLSVDAFLGFPRIALYKFLFIFPA